MAQTDWVRSEVDFMSHGSRCAAWLYLPTGVERPPVVIMAHGFGAERTFGLEPFAERFAQAGLAAFLWRDEVIPPSSVKKQHARLPGGQLVALNCSHFDPYKSPCFEEAVVTEQSFLATHLQSK
jgi:fermentation-respiration switch protein FrsA (DUF1100 family)